MKSLSFEAIINAIFVFIVCSVLACVLGHFAVAAINPDIEANPKSELEGRKYQQFPELSFDSIFEGTFQKEFSSFMADGVPKRKGVIITNALLQRKAIEVSNCLFGYETYPTFFGSKYIYTPSTGQVTEKPLLQRDESVENLEDYARVYVDFIERHDDIRWGFAFPDRSDVSRVAPGHDLVSGPADSLYWEKHFLGSLPEGCASIDLSYDDAAAWSNDFFKTDHHWAIGGGYSAYAKICASFGKVPASVGEPYEVKTGTFWGSAARRGLCFAGEGDQIFDYRYEGASLSVAINGDAKNMTSLDKGIFDPTVSLKKTSKFTNVYAQWFHTDYGQITIESGDEAAHGSLLIIGDSFTNNMERFFAHNYETVYVLDPRYYKGSIDEFVGQHEIDDAVFILSEPSIVSPEALDALK